MESFLTRTEQLFGADTINLFKNKRIAIIGLGGVGGTCLEALARTGFQNFFLMDGDVVQESNLNRQILYTREDLGIKKVDAATKHLRLINKEIEISSAGEFLNKENADKYLSDDFDFIVDAIDDLEGKLILVGVSETRKIPLISSLGMGNRYDLRQLEITTLDKTTIDPLAKKFRHLLRINNFDLKKVNVVYSKEMPLKKTPISSYMLVPSTAGLFLAYHIILSLMKGAVKND